MGGDLKKTKLSTIFNSGADVVVFRIRTHTSANIALDATSGG